MGTHKWTLSDDVIALFLYRYGTEDLIFDIDGIGSKLGMGRNSLLARIGNFKYLDKGKGLSHVAKQSHEVFRLMVTTSKEKHMAIVKKCLYPAK